MVHEPTFMAYEHPLLCHKSLFYWGLGVIFNLLNFLRPAPRSSSHIGRGDSVPRARPLQYKGPASFFHPQPIGQAPVKLAPSAHATPLSAVEPTTNVSWGCCGVNAKRTTNAMATLEAQQLYFSYRAILVAELFRAFLGIAHNYRVICCKMGYRTDVPVWN